MNCKKIFFDNVNKLVKLTYFISSAPECFDDNWFSKIKKDVGSNWRLKVIICAINFK